MERRKSGAYRALLGLSGLLALAAVVTLLPNPNAPWGNVLGYRSVCPFAPVATAVLAFLAGTSCVLRSRFFGPRAGERRSWTAPVAAALLLTAIVSVALPAWLKAKTDATSAASARTTAVK